jgi:molecular chaperone HscA
VTRHRTIGPVTGVDGYALGVDVGTSNTVAVLRWPDGRTRPLLFDGAPVMPSAVCLDDSGRLQVGRDALRLGALNPARLELNPKRRVDESSVLLDGREIPTADLLAAILTAVARAAVEAVGFLPPAALTYPASWGAKRRDVLAHAATRAGWPPVRLVPEPVAAARYFVEVLRRPVPVGGSLAVFDFGGGTLDVAVVRNTGAGFALLGDGGIEDLGGLDVDAAIVAHLNPVLEQTSAVGWARIQKPDSLAAARNRRLFWEDVRGAKEMLSRTPVAPVAVAGTDDAVHLTREELERVAAPLVRRAVRETAGVIRRCGLRPDQLAGLFLVGGSSRLPLVARMLHSELGIAPTALEQPELPVAEGALAELVPPAPSAALTPGATSPIPVPPSGPVSTPPAGPVSPPGPVMAGAAGMTAPFASTGLLTHPSPATLATPPLRKRRPVIVAAAAALVLVVAAVVGFVVLRERAGDGYHEVSFANNVTKQGPAIAMGNANTSPNDTFTAISGDTAYLAWSDGAGLHITLHQLTGGDDRHAEIPKPNGSVSWKALVARSDVLLAYYYEYSSNGPPNHVYGFDPKSGVKLWDISIGSNDTLSSVGPVLIWADTEHHRLAALNPTTGKQKWELKDPTSGGSVLSNRVRGIYGHNDNDAPSTLNEDAPLVLTGKQVVQIASDSSGWVIDVTNGSGLGSAGTAGSNDWFFGSGKRLYLVNDDEGYHVSSFLLSAPNQGKRSYTAPATAKPEAVVPCGEGVCVLDRVNSDTKTSTVRMIDSTGQRWFTLVTDADTLTRIGAGVMVSSRAAHFVRIFTASGRDIDLGPVELDATGVRVNGATALVFTGTVTSYPQTLALTGVGLHSSTVKPLGTLDGVRGESCSWNTKVIVCAQQNQFQVWKYAH